MKIQDMNIRLQIWDTAGQEAFRSITRSYYRGSICCFLVFDVTNPESFENIHKWLDETQQYSHEYIQLILVGNKVDLEQERVISQQSAQDFANNNNLEYFETSAKTGYNVEDIFKECTLKILNKIESMQLDPNNQVLLFNIRKSLGIKQGGMKQRQEITMKKQQIQQKKKKKCCN